MLALPAFQPHASKLRIRTPVRRVWGLPPLRWVLYPAVAVSVLWLLR